VHPLSIRSYYFSGFPKDFSGAEIQAVCAKAALRAVRRAVEEGKRKQAGEVQVTIQAGDLGAALEEVKQS